MSNISVRASARPTVTKPTARLRDKLETHEQARHDKALFRAAKRHADRFESIKVAVEQLGKIGEEYKKFETVDTSNRVACISRATNIVLSAIKAEKIHDLTEKLLKDLNRRKYEGQNPLMLALEIGVGLSRSTASRYGTLGSYLLSQDIRPDQFEAKVQELGGLTKAIREAQRSKQGGRPTTGRSQPVKVHVASRALGTFSEMKDGRRLIVVLVDKEREKIKLSGVSRDPLLSRLATHLFERKLLKDLQSAKLIRVKLKKAKLPKHR